MAKTAVLFLIFNRPDTTKQVFESIKEYRPTRLYVSADGPREKVEGEKELCEKTREIVKKINWKCEVKTLFRKKNLNCKTAISEAITWFFQHEEEGIILEDDTVANKTFFPFCNYMLEKYRNDTRIFGICGSNFNKTDLKENEPYHFRYFFDVWGWATWKRVWELYDIDIVQKWKNKRVKKNLLMSLGFDISRKLYYIRNNTLALYSRSYNSWAYLFNFCSYINNGLFVYPYTNLISNVGPIGVHTIKASKFHFYPTQSIENYQNYEPICVMSEHRTYSQMIYPIFSIGYLIDYIATFHVKYLSIYPYYKKLIKLIHWLIRKKH